MDEVFSSIVNQGTDVVSAFAVMKKANPSCFLASMGVLGVNVLARLIIGLATVFSGNVVVKSKCTVAAGLILGMVEPVSGMALLEEGVRRRVSLLAFFWGECVLLLVGSVLPTFPSKHTHLVSLVDLHTCKTACSFPDVTDDRSLNRSVHAFNNKPCPCLPARSRI